MRMLSRGKPLTGLVRSSWPLLGAACGGWWGLRGLQALPHNADSFATLLAGGVFGLLAWVGLCAGFAIGALAGGASEWLLRRGGLGQASALGLATLLNALLLWQLVSLLHAQFPGLRAPAAQRATATMPQSSLRIARPNGAASTAASACTQAPPEAPRERKLWDAECR